MDANDDALGSDLIFEGKAIAKYWGLSERKCRHLMASGQLPGAFQIGGAVVFVEDSRQGVRS